MIDTIVLVTCNHFGISQSTLIKGRKNVANRTNAIGVCAVLLLRLCSLSQREIADILRKDPTLINKYIRKIDTLDLNFKEEIDVVTKMEAIKEDIRKQLEIK
jgi:chromosomal replication initiation ATPase DnaA